MGTPSCGFLVPSSVAGRLDKEKRQSRSVRDEYLNVSSFALASGGSDYSTFLDVHQGYETKQVSCTTLHAVSALFFFYSFEARILKTQIFKISAECKVVDVPK